MSTFNRYVEVNGMNRHLFILSDDYGRFPQHYVKSKGWYTCLDQWVSCPFCAVDGGERYQRKIKYYFDVLELDRENGLLYSKILLLSKSRGESLISCFKRNELELSDRPFWFNKLGVGADVQFSDAVVDKAALKDVIQHDWSVICRPISLDRANQLIRDDKA